MPNHWETIVREIMFKQLEITALWVLNARWPGFACFRQLNLKTEQYNVSPWDFLISTQLINKQEVLISLAGEDSNYQC